MNAKNLLTALLTTVAASGAFAQFNGEATYEYPVATGSTTTRAQVTSEYFAARDAGQIRDGETGYVADPSQGSTAVARSREGRDGASQRTWRTGGLQRRSLVRISATELLRPQPRGRPQRDRRLHALATQCKLSCLR